MQIIIISADIEFSNALEILLNNDGYSVVIFKPENNRMPDINEKNVCFIINEFIPEKNFNTQYKILKAKYNNCHIIILTSNFDPQSTINFIDQGIDYVLRKPLNINQLLDILGECNLLKQNNHSETFPEFSHILKKINSDLQIRLSDYQLKETMFMSTPYSKALFYSKEIQKTLKNLQNIKNIIEVPLLIFGETGVGKEHIVDYFHYCDEERKNKPLIKLNCCTIAKDLFEAELFGYVGGAFTGADPNGHPGRIKEAEGGTLFLDEISEISLNQQAKLLRVLQEREFYQICGRKRKINNTRIICATNRNLEEYVKKGYFRQDLYYRLKACYLNIPPLRKRQEAIFPFTLYYIEQLNRRINHKIKYLESSVLKFFLEYSWPGNVRELKNVITNAALFHPQHTLTLDSIKMYIDTNPEIFKPEVSKKQKFRNRNFILPDQPFNLEQMNISIIKQTLDRFKGNKTLTARFLGLSRSQLYNRYKLTG